VIPGLGLCAFHAATPLEKKSWEQAGGRATAQDALEPDVAARLIKLRSLDAVPATLNRLARAVASGLLPVRLATVVNSIAGTSISALKAIEELAERERNAHRELSDSELDAAIEAAIERYMQKRNQ
jgi:hypothetical protein